MTAGQTLDRAENASSRDQDLAIDIGLLILRLAPGRPGA
jgi:putative oxidoreductase